jgi:hypothetical protein
MMESNHKSEQRKLQIQMVEKQSTFVTRQTPLHTQESLC